MKEGSENWKLLVLGQSVVPNGAKNNKNFSTKLLVEMGTVHFSHKGVNIEMTPPPFLGSEGGVRKFEPSRIGTVCGS